MKNELKVIKIKENKDGSADVTLQISDDILQKIVQSFVVDALDNYIKKEAK